MININDDKFVELHNAFREYLKNESGVPFNNFSHRLLYHDEIGYKHVIYHNAKKLLSLKDWDRWLSTSGKILEAVRDACHNSGNLLEHRYGEKGNSDSPLWLIKQEMIPDLEKLLYDLFLDNSLHIGARFDNLATFTKKNKLGNKWPFFSYLMFLYNPQIYFPIHSGPFDNLLKHYDIEVRFSRQKISWERYKIILELAEILKEKLSIYGSANAIDIQSYMWICSHLIEDLGQFRAVNNEYDLEFELQKRINAAKERERIGLLGEQFIYEEEKNKLVQRDLAKLANKVRLISIDRDKRGFDILSFDEFGSEIHIEVKTTTRSPQNDEGFWLSANEKEIAEKDLKWCIYRVWNIDSTPEYKNLGNVILNTVSDWKLDIASWFLLKVK